MSKRDLALLRKATPQEWVKAHSDAMAVIEMIWELAAKEGMKQANGDMLSKAALAACEAEEMLFDAKRFHKRADHIAARLGHLLPGGDDVIVPLVGGRG